MGFPSSNPYQYIDHSLMQIQGNTFFISGGASGLGAATARVLVQEGARVILADINEKEGHATQKELGDHSLFVKTDVTESKSVSQALIKATEAFGQIDGAINCAGIAIAAKTVGRDGPHAIEDFERVVTINLIGTFNVIRLAAAQMIQNPPNAEHERGVIVNTASVAAFDGQIGQVAYAASKGGIVGMTLPVARDLAKYGVRVMTIAPGIFDTPLLAGLPEKARQSLGEQVPFPSRLGEPDEFGLLVKHILVNPMLNGEVIRLDGAIRMAPR